MPESSSSLSSSCLYCRLRVDPLRAIDVRAIIPMGEGGGEDADDDEEEEDRGVDMELSGEANGEWNDEYVSS